MVELKPPSKAKSTTRSSATTPVGLAPFGTQSVGPVSNGTAQQPKDLKPSAVDVIAQQVRQLLGGDNPHQFFTMLMPGTIIEPSRYAYDITGEKPASVAVAESHLVNQVFDVCEVTASPNGRHVGRQYISALNALVPRFNPELTVVKNALRDFLRATPDYTRPDGTPYHGTVQDLYFELFHEWVGKKQEWELEMQSQRDALEAEHLEDPRQAEDEFIEWYESVAEGRLLELDAYMGRVLAFFSPSDMETILGVLDSGPGRLINEARRSAENAERPSPDGGTVYPVNLTPADWFTSLVSDSLPEDLLNDPLHIGFQLQAKRNALVSTLSQVKWLIASRTGELAELRSEVEAAQAEHDSAQMAMMNTFGQNLLIAYEVYLALQTGQGVSTGDDEPLGEGEEPDPEMASAVATNKNALDLESERKGEEVKNSKEAPTTPAFKDALKNVINGQKNLTQARSAFMASARKLNDAALALIAAKATTYDIEPYLIMLQAQLDEVEALRGQLTMAVKAPAPAEPPQSSSLTSGPKVVGGSSGSSDRFMNVTMTFDSSSMSKASSMSASASQSSVNVDLFLGSYSGSSSYSSGSSSSEMLDSTTSVEIGLKLTKVDIDRPWFNPGVFLASRDMDRLGTVPISTGPVNVATKSEVLRANETIFPSYPVSFVIAKDITMRFKVKESALSAAKTAIESKSAYGGGFLCFTASSTSSSQYERESLSVKTNGQTITLRINAPQIIGWFSEFVPTDRSTMLTTTDTSLAGVLGFIRKCTEQLKPAPTPPVVVAPGNGGVGRPLPSPAPSPFPVPEPR